ncbi:hypothetical protein PUR71_25365 [Streptomyces sp. SP17BM10]|uniref:hypothetical protein n=1 Tax=Streptomyces sp. SP17BM10 TaxID=3002530 RepID=UPI002E799F3B|nr:hypothetical protein [Streptomyces sp. SP17BM10]MEE1786203.1 hypothetical protein [Streptomyces sp. SP17BM10]
MRRWLAVVVVELAGLAAVVACGGPGAAPAPPPTRASTVPPGGALEDCVLSIAPWLQMAVDGGKDLGDYQEMGLSNAQGSALRELQRQAAALKAQGPLPSGWVATEVRRSCESIVAAKAAETSRPPGWP